MRRGCREESSGAQSASSPWLSAVEGVAAVPQTRDASELARREDERVPAGPRRELHVRRQRERGPAERAERIRERRAGRRIVSSSTSAGGATNGTAGVTSRSTPAQRLLDALAVLLALARGRGRLGVRHLEAALDLAADVLAVQLLVAGEERAVDVGRLAHEVGAVRRRERQLDGTPAREVLRRGRDAARARPAPPPRATRLRPRALTTLVTSVLLGKFGTSARMSSSQPSTVEAIGPTTSKLGASGKQPSAGTRP